MKGGMRMIIHEKLAHLSSRQIIKLMNEYYAGIRVKKLIEYYKVDCRPRDLHKLFPPIELDTVCPICGTNFEKKRESRTDLENLGNPYRHGKMNKPYCPSCGHVDDDICECDECVRKRSLEYSKKEAQLNKMVNEVKKEIEKSYAGMVSMDDFNMKDRVYLASLIRYALSEDASFIKCLSECETPYNVLAKGDMDEKIVDYLLNRNIIIIDINSLKYALRHDEEENRFMRYKLNFDIGDNSIATLQELMSPNIDFSDDDSILEGYKLWKEVAMNDCMAFLIDKFKTNGIDFYPVQKTYIIIDDLLKRFSISQIQYMIDKCFDNAFKLYTQKKIKRNIVTDVVFSKISSMSSFMSLKESEFPEYKNSANIPYDNFSEVLFYKVLLIGEKGFRCVPSMDIIKESVLKDN